MMILRKSDMPEPFVPIWLAQSMPWQTGDRLTSPAF
jgi:hypothetical protein